MPKRVVRAASASVLGRRTDSAILRMRQSRRLGARTELEDALVSRVTRSPCIGFWRIE